MKDKIVAAAILALLFIGSYMLVANLVITHQWI